MLILGPALIAATVIGVLAVFGPIPALIVTASLVALGLIARRPRWLAYGVLFGGMTTLPEFVPYQVQLGATTVYVYEPLLAAAALWSLVALRPPKAVLVFSGAIIAVLAVWGVVGLGMGYPLTALLNDLRGHLVVALFVVVCGGFVGSGYQAEALKVLRVSLWISASFTLAGSVMAFPLAGRSEAAELFLIDGQSSAASDATRLLTASSELSVLVVCVCLGLALTGAVKLRATWTFLLPAFFIALIGFSRNSLLTVAVAVAVAFVLGGLRGRSLGAAVGIVAVAAIGGGIITLVIAANLPGSDYLAAQFNGFADRVLGGLSNTSLANDSSVIARNSENMYAVQAIQQAPMTGHGFGFPYRPPVGEAGGFAATSGQYFAHNYWLWILIKAGILGLAIIVAALVLPIIKAARSSKPYVRSLAAAGVGLLASLAFAPFPNGPTDGGSLAVGMLFGAILASAYPRLDAEPRIELRMNADYRSTSR